MQHERESSTPLTPLNSPSLTQQWQMLFTWDTTNLCIIFRWWHIRSTFSLIISLLGIVALTAGYEAIRSLTRRYETWVEKQQGSITRKLSLSLSISHIPHFPPRLSYRAVE